MVSRRKNKEFSSVEEVNIFDPEVRLDPKLIAAVVQKAQLDSLTKRTEAQIQNDIAAINNRASAITVGTAFGGTIEISLRKPNGESVYVVVQPVEAIELIHQLAAASGCHIHLQPREDFASWRKWKPDTNRYEHPQVEHAPHSEYPKELFGARELPPPEKQPGMQPKLMAKEKENAVATKKAVNKRSPKRSRSTTK